MVVCTFDLFHKSGDDCQAHFVRLMFLAHFQAFADDANVLKSDLEQVDEHLLPPFDGTVDGEIVPQLLIGPIDTPHVPGVHLDGFRFRYLTMMIRPLFRSHLLLKRL